MLSEKHFVGKPMKVKIKKLGVDMDVKNTGVEFQVHGNDDVFKGDFYVTGANLIWCQGKTSKSNGKKIPWDVFITWAEKNA